MSRKDQVIKAMTNYYRKNSREPVKRKSKNNKPEKITEAQVLAWAKSNSIHLHVIDSSNWNGRTGAGGQQKAETGFPDLVGNNDSGLCLFVELKALGRCHNLSPAQKRFLEKKIDQNCFAAVADSSQRLQRVWQGFCDLKSPELRQQFLRDQLPQKRKNPSAEKSLGFDVD